MQKPEKNKICLLADECVSHETIEFLRSLGYKISMAKDFNLLATQNGTVLNTAIKKSFIFLTEDHDFCNIRLYPPHLTRGIIVIKVSPQLDKKVWSVLKSLVDDLKPEDFDKSLVVVDHNRYRIRRELPDT